MLPVLWELGLQLHQRRPQVCPSMCFAGFLLLNPDLYVKVMMETGLIEYLCLRRVENLNNFQELCT